MAKVIFNYKGVEKEIQCKINQKIKDILKKYANIVEVDISKVNFIYNGNIIDDNDFFINEIINEEDKRRNIMNILVYENIKTTIIKENITIFFYFFTFIKIYIY